MPADNKPTFTVEWSLRSSVNFPIPANTYEDMYKFFQKKKANKEDWGRFAPKHDIEWIFDKVKQTSEIKLQVGYTIALPSWSKASSSGKKGKMAWDAMMLKLKKHEDGHADIFEEEIDKFGTAVVSSQNPTMNVVKELYKKFLDNLDKAQKAYDSKTAFGEKEGVSLPPPDKVKE